MLTSTGAYTMVEYSTSGIVTLIWPAVTCTFSPLNVVDPLVSRFRHSTLWKLAGWNVPLMYRVKPAPGRLLPLVMLVTLSGPLAPIRDDCREEMLCAHPIDAAAADSSTIRFTHLARMQRPPEPSYYA